MPKRELIKNYQQETYQFQKRLWFGIVFILLLLVLLICRLFYLQVIQHNLYTTLSRENQFSLIPIEPNRGLIYDRNGVLLAENIPIFSLDIVPERVQNLAQTIAELQKIINITPEDLEEFQKSLKQHRPFEPVPLKMKLTDEEVARFYVDQYKYPGVSVDANLMRYYPFGAAMNSVIGHVGRISEQDQLQIDTANYAGSDYIGKIGIEKYFEPELHGTVGYQQVEINAAGRVVRSMKRIPTIPGENLYLTIDSNLQLAAEQALGNISGAVVIIQPQTGQILAFVSNPSFDPNAFVNGISHDDFQQLQNNPERPLFNRAARGQFPIGSTIKPFMAIAGLDYGIITPTYSMMDPGWFALPGVSHVYHDWVYPRNHGKVDVVKAIIVSCDTFMYNLGWRMGIERLDENLVRFGFGSKTGIEMEEELPGLVPTPAWKQKTYGAPWFAGDTVSASIGQGYVLGTPLQMAQAVSIIANRGIRYKPTFLLKVQKPDGTFINHNPVSEQAVVLSDPHIWDLVIQGMEGVVSNPMGTAYRNWQSAPYTAAGKTGTVQVVRREQAGEIDQATIPYNLRNHSMFIGYAPVENPQIAIAVVAEHSLVPARLIARRIVDYYLLNIMHGKYNIPGKEAPPITMQELSPNQPTTTPGTAATPAPAADPDTDH